MTKKKKEPRMGLDVVSILKRDLKNTVLWAALSAGVVVLLASFQHYIF